MGTWSRRLVTFPAYTLVGALLLVGLPLWLLLAGILDVVSPRRFIRLRAVAMLLVYVLAENLGVFLSGILWVVHLLGRDREAFVRRNYRLQELWVSTLYGAMERFFSVRTTWEVPPILHPGPLLVFMRHSATADTLLSLVLLGGRSGLRLRYVLKEELLWDPCLDVVGGRLPNAFVRRGTGEEAVLGALRTLANNLSPADGILLYPEGTRSSPRKKAEQLATLSGAAREHALALRHLLLPRLGGALTLLDAAPTCDVLFVGHVGLEGTTHPRELLSGAFVGRHIQARAWRVPAADIPRDREGRVAWLHDHWQRMDDWVAEIGPYP